MSLLKEQMMKYQEVLVKIKQKLNINGDIDFRIGSTDKPAQNKQKHILKLNRFADIVLLLYKRMYTDLENQKNYNNNLENKFKL